MAYSDLQNKILSYIAYMDFHKRFTHYKNTTGNQKLPLSLALEADEKEELLKIGISETELDSWNILVVHDRNYTNGFYASIIETSPKDVVIAFRGSESDKKNIYNDWVKADFALLDSVQTEQQAESIHMLKENEILLGNYENISLVGHSLGGNLAEYATIMSEGTSIEKKIKSCVSLDGPGFSNEFIKLNKDKISKMSPQMLHFRWSMVGECLIDLPGVNYQYVKVSNDANNLDSKTFNIFTRHDLKYLALDKNGSFITEDPVKINKIVGITTKVIELSSKGLSSLKGSTVLSLACASVIMWAKSKLFRNDVSAEKRTIESEIANFLVSYSIKTRNADPRWMAIFTSLASLYVVTYQNIQYFYRNNIDRNIYQKINDLAKKTGKNISDSIAGILNWTEGKLGQIETLASSFLDRICKTAEDLLFGANKFNKYNINYGSVIKLDTYKMRNYADRLLAVNRKIYLIDEKLSAIYKKSGLTDLWDLIQADTLIDTSYQLARCAKYLHNVADEFESVERELANRFS